MNLRSVVLALAFATLAFAAAPERAHARRGILVVNTGEDFFETGPLPAPYDSIPELSGYSGAYKCSIFGVFWMYFATWSCTPVAFNESTDEYVDAPEIVTALSATYSESDMSLGFWKGGMRWVLLGLLVLGFVGQVFLRGNAADDGASGGIAEPSWKRSPRVLGTLAEFAKTDAWTFDAPADGTTYRVVSAKGWSGAAYVDADDPSATTVMVLVERGDAPRHLQLALDANGVLHRTELQPTAFQAAAA